MNPCLLALGQPNYKLMNLNINLNLSNYDYDLEYVKTFFKEFLMSFKGSGLIELFYFDGLNN